MNQFKLILLILSLTLDLSIEMKSAVAAPAPTAIVRGVVEGFNSKFIFIRQKSGEILRISKKLLPKNAYFRPGQRIRIFVNSNGRSYQIESEE